jgi:hypothetical protein
VKIQSVECGGQASDVTAGANEYGRNGRESRTQEEEAAMNVVKIIQPVERNGDLALLTTAAQEIVTATCHHS